MAAQLERMHLKPWTNLRQHHCARRLHEDIIRLRHKKLYSCDWCSKVGHSGKTRVCEPCSKVGKSIRYCNEQCQLWHWRAIHRDYCEKAQLQAIGQAQDINSNSTAGGHPITARPCFTTCTTLVPAKAGAKTAQQDSETHSAW